MSQPFVSVTIRVPTLIMKSVDEARGPASRSAWVLWKLSQAVEQMANPKAKAKAKAKAKVKAISKTGRPGWF